MERVIELITPGVKFLVRPEKYNRRKYKLLDARTKISFTNKINSELTHDICG
jgi:hypothetical protein